LAENSEWFRVSGNVAKCEVELLRRAIDPVEALRRQIVQAKTLKDALARVRDLLGGEKLQGPIRDAALDAIDKLAADDTAPLDQRISAWMLLREHRKETPTALKDRLMRHAAQPTPTDPSVPPSLWAFLQRISGAREQEKSVELLPEVHGETWVDEAVRNLAHASPGMARALIEALRKAGRGEDLARWYVVLLARPNRNPFVFVWNYIKAVVGELRKVIWPNRKQMVSYTTVMMVFLTFMVALISFVDIGLHKLVLWVFG